MPALTIVLIALFGGVLVCHFQSAIQMPMGWNRIEIFGLPFTLIVYGTVGRELTTGSVPLKTLVPLGDASYSVYLSHSLVINAVGLIWMKAPGIVSMSNWIWLALIAGSAILAGFISYRLIEQPILVCVKKYPTRRHS